MNMIKVHCISSDMAVHAFNLKYTRDRAREISMNLRPT